MMKEIIFNILILILIPQLLKAEESITGTTKSTIMAGVCKVDITPPLNIPLGGYSNRTGPATAVRDSLKAVVIVFDDGKTRVAIVTLDIIQVKYNEGQQFFRAIERETGIKEDHVIINASHTHGSPWLETDAQYSDEVIKKVAAATRIAAGRLFPVTIAYGEGEVNFNVSRRIINEDGVCITGLNPGGLTDHRVKILRLDGQTTPSLPKAILFHAVCHPNVFRWQNTEITADFPGEAKSFIEQNFGNGTTALFLQGCAGDIRANLPEEGKKPFESSFGRSGSEADMLWCGWSTGAEVVKTTSWLGVEEQIKRSKADFTIKTISGLIKVSAKTKLTEVTWPREHIIDGKVYLPVKMIKIGEICFVAIPGEPVVEYSFKIEHILKGLGFENIFVMGYTAGDAGYIPTKKMFNEGGYEAIESALLPSCEDEIIKGVAQLALKLVNQGD